MIDLTPVERGDGERLFLWRREPEVERWMCGRAAESWDEHERWLDGFLANPDTRGWIIRSRGQPVGLLTLKGLSGCDRCAQWGWYIGEAQARGRGVGRAAQALGLDLAFDELGLHKVAAEVLADNEVALKAQASAGFRREGYLREQAMKDGRFRDVVLLGILEHEWRAGRAGFRESLARSGLIAS